MDLSFSLVSLGFNIDSKTIDGFVVAALCKGEGQPIHFHAFRQEYFYFISSCFLYLNFKVIFFNFDK